MQNLLEVSKHKIMPIYPFEILEHFFQDQQNNKNIMKLFDEKKMNFIFIDCRLEEKSLTLPKSYHIPKKIESKEVINLKNFVSILKFFLEIQ